MEILKRVLTAEGEAVSIASAVVRLANTPVAIWDTEDNLLLCAANADLNETGEKHPILCGDKVIGWASGGRQMGLVSELLTCLVAREAEKEELLDEILDLYRQVNLLFNLSGKLTASLELEIVATTTLDEACRLIEATGGVVVLLSEESALRQVATVGHGVPVHMDAGPQGGIVGAVVAGARAEIINDVRLDTRYFEGRDSMRSLLCAPLTSMGRALGAIVIISEAPVMYTAADLSLLNTLASQAAPAIENALAYERALRKAQEREEKLRRQVLRLRIELDEARQQEKVAEITGSEYYQRLRDRAGTLRSIISGPGNPRSD
jgi:transcriptional regulator with GAF, ATPase, and Fis domain